MNQQRLNLPYQDTLPVVTLTLTVTALSML